MTTIQNTVQHNIQICTPKGLTEEKKTKIEAKVQILSERLNLKKAEYEELRKKYLPLNLVILGGISLFAIGAFEESKYVVSSFKKGADTIINAQNVSGLSNLGMLALGVTLAAAAYSIFSGSLAREITLRAEIIKDKATFNAKLEKYKENYGLEFPGK